MAEQGADNLRKFTVGYVVGLSLIAILMIAAYLMVQKELAGLESDARVINLAGRQRMLSHLITNRAILLTESYGAKDALSHYKALEEHFIDWVNMQKGLQHGDESLSLPGNNSSVIAGYFKKMRPSFEEIENAVNTLLAQDPESTSMLYPASSSISEIINASPVYLKWMDKAVFQYQQEADKKHHALTSYQLYILYAVLFLLLFETIFIFRPIMAGIKSSYNKIKQTNVGMEKEIEERRWAEKLLQGHAKNMESALIRAEEVLNLLAKLPGLMPFFVSSPVYRRTKTIGGGDTIRRLDFQSQYVGIYLHDVSGHDIHEILLNILATAVVDDHKINPTKKAVSVPSIFLTEMNERLRQYCGETAHYVTAAYLLIDFANRSMKLSLAGQPKPWLISSDGTAVQVGEVGYIMGQFEIKPGAGDRYKDFPITLENGQLLFLYSDGLMEQEDEAGLLFEEKFEADIVPMLKGLAPDEAFKLVQSEFETHLGENSPGDDVSFVFIGCRPVDRYETIEFIPSKELIASIKGERVPLAVVDGGIGLIGNLDDIEEEPSCKIIDNISEAYEPILGKLSSSGWSQDSISKIKIALSELVMNAIIHGNLYSGCGSVKVEHILHSDVLEVSVTDIGSGIDDSTLPQTFDDEEMLKTSGRGHYIISMYADIVFFNGVGNKCWVIFKKDNS